MHEEVLSRAYPAFDNAIDEVIRKRGVKKIQSSIEKQLDQMLFSYEGREVGRGAALEIVRNICSVEDSVMSTQEIYKQKISAASMEKEIMDGMNTQLNEVKQAKSKSIKAVWKDSYNKVYDKIINEKMNEIEPFVEQKTCTFLTDEEGHRLKRMLKPTSVSLARDVA